MTINLETLSKITGSELNGNSIEFKSLSIDSRTIQKDETFLCIKGKNFDGHNFIEQAISAGASSIIISKDIVTKLPRILIKDAHSFLNRFSEFKRRNFNGKVICLTGSNGKTTTKDLIAHILSSNGSVHKTIGNRNNQIGVPLTLINLDQEDFSVVEIGTNSPGEISFLSSLVKPDVALITNAHNSHLMGLQDKDSVAKEKGDIINSLGKQGVLVLPKDSKYYEYWKGRSKGIKLITFGKSESSDLRVSYINQNMRNKRTDFGILLNDEEIVFSINTIGEHNVINAAAALAVTHSLNINIKEKINYLDNIDFPDRRFSLKDSINGGLLIDDSYNSNPESMKKLIDAVSKEKNVKVLMAGEMLELGDRAEEFHHEICSFASGKVDYFLSIGDMWKEALDDYNGHGVNFKNQEELLEYLEGIELKDPIMLVKGSRSTNMDKLADKLTL